MDERSVEAPVAVPEPTEAEKFAALLANLQSKFPGAQAFTSMGKTIIGRKPNRMEYRRFRQLMLDEATRGVAHESLLGCILHPDPVTLSGILDELPGLESAFANALLDLVGHGAPVQKKSS